MLIRVMYSTGKYDMVKDSLLDELIASGGVQRFLRSDGWATKGREPVRGRGGAYTGPERRKSAAITKE
ncbi:MAG: GSU3473 family protein [Thermodesulfovibrionales bacterium]|jgi:hypothetical protein